MPSASFRGQELGSFLPAGVLRFSKLLQAWLIYLAQTWAQSQQWLENRAHPKVMGVDTVMSLCCCPLAIIQTQHLCSSCLGKHDAELCCRGCGSIPEGSQRFGCQVWGPALSWCSQRQPLPRGDPRGRLPDTAGPNPGRGSCSLLRLLPCPYLSCSSPQLCARPWIPLSHHHLRADVRACPVPIPGDPHTSGAGAVPDCPPPSALT